MIPHQPCVGYTIIFTPRATKDFARLNKTDVTKIWDKIKELTINKPNLDIKKLAGTTALYRLRVGNYRVIYQIAQRIITIYIVAVGHRKDIYKKLPNVTR